MADPLAALQQLGFGDLEARLYAALLPHGALTAYALAKAAGVTRPNVYPALHRLQERGAVVRIEGEGGAVHYVAVAADEVCARIHAEQEAAVAAAQAALAALRPAAAPLPGPLVSTGYENLLAQACRLCEQARDSVLVGLTPREAARLAGPLAAAAARGASVGGVCLCACPVPGGHCPDAVVSAALLPPGDGPRWLLCVRDEQEAVIGEIGADGSALCTRSGPGPLVTLASTMMCYAAALAAGGTRPSAVGAAEFGRWAAVAERPPRPVPEAGA